MPAAQNNNNTKKYKLFSAATSPDGGGKPTCAFFVSAQGCRNGSNCKFAHIKQQAGGVCLDSLVSSESEGEEQVEIKAVSSTVKNNKSSNTFASMANSSTKQPAAADDDASPFVKSVSDLPASSGKAKKRNKKRSSQNGISAPMKENGEEDDSPFAAPKSKKPKQMQVGVVTTQKLSNDKDPSAPKPQQKVQHSKVKTAPAVPSFRALNLPVASFSTLKEEEPEPANTVIAAPPPAQPQVTGAPLPTSTESGRKWLKLVQQTRAHPRYNDIYDLSKYKVQDVAAGYAANSWVTSPPYDASNHATLPQIIALDCEMCETRDPVSGQTDPRALCRISVLDVETDEVLLDSLVKPAWPVSNYRSWVNGITAEHLEPVQFTLRHAQAFLLALCSQETVVLGHSLQNDLAALRWEHGCVADPACLFSAHDSDTAVVALRDLARTIHAIDMPTTHDSVHDARVAYQCLEHYRVQDGNVEAIVRTPKPESPENHYARQLFVHRIPQQACDETQLAQMFVVHTCVKPSQVDTIEFGSNKANSGKTLVHFSTGRHAGLAFDTLEGTPEVDASGRLQKKVFLRNGSYIRVRKMAFERKDSRSGKEGGSNNNNNNDSSKRRLSS